MDISTAAEKLGVPEETLSQFQELDAKKTTSPSAILINGLEEMSVKKLSPKKVEQYLLVHPVIPRGIEIKANRMTARGYQISPGGTSDTAKQAAEDMRQLLDVSGGTLLLNGWIKDGYGFGNGYTALLPDENSGEIVRISREHPMFMRIARKKDNKKEKTPYSELQNTGDFPTEYGGMKIDPVTKKPTAYTQVVYENPESDKVHPIGRELDADEIAHLVFDTWGDEAEGISLVQYLNGILTYIMNIEEAGAEAIYRSGFTQKKITTDINNEDDLIQLGKNLNKLSASDAMILPEGTDIQNLTPGSSEMDRVHDIFLTLLAIRLGVPKPILTLDGTSTNKATMRELMRDLIYDITADELKVKTTIEEQIFKRACKIKYGEDFEEIPVFKFNEFEENIEERATVLSSMSESVERFANAYEKLTQNGQTGVANEVLKYITLNIKKAMSDEDAEELENIIQDTNSIVQNPENNSETR